MPRILSPMKQSMRGHARLEGAGPLTFPGEPEAAMEEECYEMGIPYHASIPAGIKKVCEELGVEYDL